MSLLSDICLYPIRHTVGFLHLSHLAKYDINIIELRICCRERGLNSTTVPFPMKMLMVLRTCCLPVVLLQ